jgi:hypothetical protein
MDLVLQDTLYATNLLCDGGEQVLTRERARRKGLEKPLSTPSQGQQGYLQLATVGSDEWRNSPAFRQHHELFWTIQDYASLSSSRFIRTIPFLLPWSHRQVVEVREVV